MSIARVVEVSDWSDFQLRTCRQVIRGATLAIATIASDHFLVYSNVAAIR